MKRLFGTDGVRGIANREPVTPETTLRLAKVTGIMFSRKSTKVKALLGKDTRISGDMLEAALISGLTSVGVEVINVGVIPTPGISYLTSFAKADFGIVISASHNPMEDNGIKFFSNNGLKLPDDMEEKIEKNLFDDGFLTDGPIGGKLGKVYNAHEFENNYEEFLLRTFPEGLNLNGLKIVIDCANGSTSKIAPEVYAKLGAKVFVINNRPDGININRKCGSLYPDVVCKATVQHKADMGFSFDGDGDRVIICDSNGNIVDGDYVMAICARAFLSKNELKNKLVVATIMSNIGLEISLKEVGGKLFRAPVGDKFVFENMIKHGSILGGEQSGHIIFLNKLSTGDGIITSLQILKVIKETGKDLKTLAKCMRKYPQVLVNVEVKIKKDLNVLPSVLNVIKEVEAKLKNKGRVVVRFSGTEPLARVMLEGESIKELKELSGKICAAIKKELG